MLDQQVGLPELLVTCKFGIAWSKSTCFASLMPAAHALTDCPTFRNSPHLEHIAHLPYKSSRQLHQQDEELWPQCGDWQLTFDAPRSCGLKLNHRTHAKDVEEKTTCFCDIRA